MLGKLLLLPNVLDESLPHASFLPAGLPAVIEQLHGLIAESEKSARRYLRRFLSHEKMAAMPLQPLNEHTTHMEELIAPIQRGETWGLISDAGLPCIADPGSSLITKLHRLHIPVETFAGPCSIIMALQLSGFSGQRFAFHGYLSRERLDLEKELLELQRQAARTTQIWIEAPYRSQKMLETLLQTLHDQTLLCVAVNLTSPTQRLFSAPIAQWRSHPFPLGKEPSIFLIA